MQRSRVVFAQRQHVGHCGCRPENVCRCAGSSGRELTHFAIDTVHGTSAGEVFCKVVYRACNIHVVTTIYRLAMSVQASKPSDSFVSGPVANKH